MWNSQVNSEGKMQIFSLIFLLNKKLKEANKIPLLFSYPCVCVPPHFLKSGRVEPEETAVTIPYKLTYDMWHDAWKPE
jgi:hypothetical protein